MRLMDHLLTVFMATTLTTHMHVHPMVIGAQIISMKAFLLVLVRGSAGALDRDSGAVFTISMISGAGAAFEASAFEISGARAACVGGVVATPTVAAASEAEHQVAAASAEQSLVAATEDSMAVDSVA